MYSVGGSALWQSYFCVMSTYAIGESEARSTSRGQVSDQNVRKSKKYPAGVIRYVPVYEEGTVPGMVRCQACNRPPTQQSSVVQAGQTSSDVGSEVLSHDSFEGHIEVRPARTSAGVANDDLLSFAPRGHLRMAKQPRSSSLEALDLATPIGGRQVNSLPVASAGRKLKKVSPEASSRFVGETVQLRLREQLARLGGGGLRANDAHYRSKRLPDANGKLRSRQLMDGTWELEGPRHQLRQVVRELKLVMARENLVPVEGDYSSYGLSQGVTRVRNQDREIVRNIRAFYNHRQNMQTMRVEIPGWVVEALAPFQMLPHCLAYAVYRAGATPFEVWKWYKSPKSSYEAKVIMHDHHLCGASEQGSKQVNCKGAEGGVLVDRGLLAYLRCRSAFQTRNRNLMVSLLASCKTYQIKYAVSDVCLARITPGTVMCAYMFSKEEELALSLAADTAMGDNLMRATNRQMGNSIRFMPHHSWREALFYGGLAGWYHHVTGGTTVVGNR